MYRGQTKVNDRDIKHEYIGLVAANRFIAQTFFRGSSPRPLTRSPTLPISTHLHLISSPV